MTGTNPVQETLICPGSRSSIRSYKLVREVWDQGVWIMVCGYISSTRIAIHDGLYMIYRVVIVYDSRVYIMIMSLEGSKGESGHGISIH